MTCPVGLVLGRFYPPHAGHHFLIDAAANACDTLYVLVLGCDTESIPLTTRMSWISDAHQHQTNIHVLGAVDNTPTDYEDPNIWAQHVAIFSSAIAPYQRRPVTTLFTSEPYGDELAARMGLVHVLVDPARVTVPLSATMVRSDALRYADLLAPATRAGLAARVVILGAESTGTSTLAADLALSLSRTPTLRHASLVTEYGHEYATEKLLVAKGLARARGHSLPDMSDLSWSDDEFTHIASEQNRREDEAARNSGLLLICDTDAFTTGLWQQRYRGHLSPDVAALARPHPLYILTHHEEVAFEQDGTRDGEHLRAIMTDQFEAALLASGRPYVVVRGSRPQRVEAATAAIDDLLRASWWSDSARVQENLVTT